MSESGQEFKKRGCGGEDSSPLESMKQKFKDIQQTPIAQKQERNSDFREVRFRVSINCGCGGEDDVYEMEGIVPWDSSIKDGDKVSQEKVENTPGMFRFSGKDTWLNDV